GLARDARFGIRRLARTPGQTLAAVIALALGIGLSTAVFSMTYGIVVRGLPFEEPEELLHLESDNPSQDQESLGVYLQDFLEWRRRQTSFEGLAAFYNETVNLSGDSHPERVEGAYLSANAFDLLRARPVVGRGFRAGEDSPHAERVVVLGWGIWQARYDGDPDIVGRRVRVNGMPATVVGVMPKGFGFPLHQQVWQPLRLDPGRLPRGGAGQTVEVFGRLRDGVTLEQARTEMTGIARALAAELPATNQGRGAVVRPYTEKYLGDGPAGILRVMLGACLLVLLLGCINVAALTTARAAQRSREMALRAALGAPRGRLVRLLLVETFLVAALGTVLAIPLALAGVRTFTVLIAERNVPFWVDVALDHRALLFAAGLTLLAGLASGLVPALQAARAGLAEVLKDEGRSTSLRMGWTMRAIAVVEVAVSCALLVGAGLMIQNVRHVSSRTEFRTSRLFTARLSLNESGYAGNAERVRFVEELLRRLREDPAVLAAAAGSYVPATGSPTSSYAVEGEAYAAEKDYPVAHVASVSAGFFERFGAGVLRGRDFGTLAVPGSLPVVLVNQSFARESWPGQDPLGRRIRIALNGRDEPWRTVVGVVPDLAMEYVATSDEGAGFYLPLSQEGSAVVNLVIETRDPDPLTITQRVRDHVAAVDSDLPIYYVYSMERAVEIVGFFPRFFAATFSIFGLCALLLASVGIYGVLALSVQRRTPEIGIRMALGARPGNVLGLVFRQGLTELLLGLALGLLLAWPTARLMSGLLVGVDPQDPPTFLGVALVLTAVSLLACWFPARRASRTDPVAAIRYD
ncbi:MAG TPA: ABC transporter permease, partial [Thermoanaerobaculia bacterium]